MARCENKEIKQPLKYNCIWLFYSTSTLQRYMKAISFTKVLLEDFDESTGIIQRSGKHTKRSSANDRKKIVEELMSCKAFTPDPKRKYSVFKDFKSSLLADFDFHGFYSWIDQHKDDVEKRRKAC